jgi:hypothetical protein
VRWRRDGSWAAWGAWGALALLAGCRDPTEVTLVISTDVPCAMLNGTTITVGTPDSVETKATVADTQDCVNGNIGTFVVVPSSGQSDAFAVRVVSGIGAKAARDCTPGGQPNYQGCIVARRELAFEPHTPLTVPIVMSSKCANVMCSKGQTCVEGTCANDMIGNCTGAGCSEGMLLDGGLDAPMSGPLPDAAPGMDSTPDAPSPFDSSAADAPPPGEAGLADAPHADAADAANTPDAGDASAPTDAPVVADANPLGSCVAAGSSTGVTCGGASCSSSQVCCVAQPQGGTATSYCSTLAACDPNASSGTMYSALACRNRGDCASGVCCFVPSTVAGGGASASCMASCPGTFSQVQVCRNACECGGTTACGVPTGGSATKCSPLSIATCGGYCP